MLLPKGLTGTPGVQGAEGKPGPLVGYYICNHTIGQFVFHCMCHEVDRLYSFAEINAKTSSAPPGGSVDLNLNLTQQQKITSHFM